MKKKFYLRRSQYKGISRYKGRGGKSKLELMEKYMYKRTLILIGLKKNKIMNFDFDNNFEHVHRNINNYNVVLVADNSSEICLL